LPERILAAAEKATGSVRVAFNYRYPAASPQLRELYLEAEHHDGCHRNPMKPAR
jgi:predicted dehydrogenase